MKYDAFISHSSKDYDRVSEIVASLEKEGVKCFVSYRDIPHCDDWADILIDALKASKCVVYIHTEESNSSKHVWREVQIAIDSLNKPVVTYRLTDQSFNGSLMFFLQTLNWIDSFPDHMHGIEELHDTILMTQPEVDHRSEAENELTLQQGTVAKKSDDTYIWISVAILTIVGCGLIGYKLYDYRKLQILSDTDRYENLVQRAQNAITSEDSL